MKISYHTQGCNYRLAQKRLVSRWLEEVARLEGYEIEEVNYIFCDSESHREMNRQFVGHDYFTDIITFDYSRRKEGVVGGDVYIDAGTVKDNARIYTTTFRREMLRVVVHGVLHLCGQKDKTPRTEKEMHRKEDRYLNLWDNMLQNID